MNYSSVAEVTSILNAPSTPHPTTSEPESESSVCHTLLTLITGGVAKQDRYTALRPECSPTELPSVVVALALQPSWTGCGSTPRWPAEHND